MTPGRVAASRASEVRRAARAWEGAGVIDGPTRAAIEEAYPSDAHAHARAWRVVIFVVATVAALAAFLALATVLRAAGTASWLVYGAILAFATEKLDRSTLRGNGAAGATSFWAVVMISVGFASLAEKGSGGDHEVDVALLVAALAFALACWRWGIEAYGAIGALACFLFLAQYPGGRLLWIVAALVLLTGSLRFLDRPALAPEHRAAVAGVFGTSAIALYVAVNSFSVDRRFIEGVLNLRGSNLQSSTNAQAAAAFATAILPLVFLVWGIWTRRRLVLDLGALFAAASLATLCHYVHLGPLWAVLCAAGAAVLLLALALNRKLRRSEDGEWEGFTARPLYSGMGALPAAAAVAGFAPDARLPQPPDSPGFSGGGGQSGGGGAAGSF